MQCLNPPTSTFKKQKQSVGERAAAEGDEADQGVWGAMDGYEYDGGYDHPEVDYGADHMSDDAGML